jgi:hypothetical protein
MHVISILSFIFVTISPVASVPPSERPRQGCRPYDSKCSLQGQSRPGLEASTASIPRYSNPASVRSIPSNKHSILKPASTATHTAATQRSGRPSRSSSAAWPTVTSQSSRSSSAPWPVEDAYSLLSKIRATSFCSKWLSVTTQTVSGGISQYFLF